MLGAIGFIALLTVLGLSLVITRVATVALTLTGLSYEAARFQARSAFTGTGFTTHEAEKVVSHPVRRRIIMALMLVRSAGILTIILSLILSFAGTRETTMLYRLIGLVVTVAGLWLLSLSRLVERVMRRVMEWALRRWTNLDVRDYAGLLELSGDYLIRELRVEQGDWLAGRKVAECNLHEEGISILGVHRDDGSYVGVPRSVTQLHPGDTLVLYGRAEAIADLDRRRHGGEGDREHREAVDDQQRHMARQEREEEEYERESRNGATPA